MTELLILRKLIEQRLKLWTQLQNRSFQGRIPWVRITVYQDGMITKTGIPVFVFEHLTPDNVGEFIDSWPTELLTLLQAAGKKLPAEDDEDDDDGWKNVNIHHGGTYAPWVPVEEIREAEAENDRRYREGVRLFREYLDSP